MKISVSALILSFAVVWGIACSSESIRQTPEPALEQVLFHSDPLCPGFHVFCSQGDTKSLTFRGVYKNPNGEKTVYLDYFLSSFEVSFPIGVSLKLDGTWFNLRKVGTDYSDSMRISSLVPADVSEKILAAKEITFSFSSREKTTNQLLSKGEIARLQSLLKSLREKLDAQAKLNILNL
ncbi:hypothetical protein DLM76_13595 [Leptospira yasudae]|uniref:hypothetical protein n=1 Tax=Leptospira yasudae TaxID=2202201 RepID=UPI000E59E2AB|nr:hypothetical protein [Leptospira yasudae]RHX94003.1 hypothetical protein DLM76_13595 [Leptospira yasudae]TGK25819.1 hypothetical protein EHQ05_13135 [Leptospira yasudae]TGM02919.1 hypothetical protein EHQ86_17850 [Leptospira yasudae]TGM99182.1 hypothetical protein EHR10_09855 [Leptospira yasudae]